MLAKAREEAGLTVVELAQRANPGRTGGLSRYYDAEAGRRMATSETVSHYARVLDREDLHDIRNKILSKRPQAAPRLGSELGDRFRAAPAVPLSVAHASDVAELVAEPGRAEVLATSAPHGGGGAALASVPTGDNAHAHVGDAGGPPGEAKPGEYLPRPQWLSDELREPVERFLAAQPDLVDGMVVRGREAVVGAACALLQEALELNNRGTGSVSVQIIQLNSERSFTRNILSGRSAISRYFPYQLQRLVQAGGSVRHLLSNEIIDTTDLWTAFERFIALMEMAGDYSVYMPSRAHPRARASDYLIVENVAALELYPTDPLTWTCDTAVIHRHPSEVLSIVKDFGENLIAESNEVFQVTDPSSTYAVEQAQVRVEEAILESEQASAPRFLFKYGLSTLCEPLKDYEARLLDQHDLPPDDRTSWPQWVKMDLEIRRRRLANFLRQIERYPSVDVVPLSALRYFVEHGAYSKDCVAFGGYPVSIEGRIKQLENVITLISTNKLYDVVVIADDPPLDHLEGAGFMMMGAPDDEDSWTVFYQSVKPGPGGNPISVAFETSLPQLREPIGRPIATVAQLVHTEDATEQTLRLLHGLIDELRGRLS